MAGLVLAPGFLLAAVVVRSDPVVRSDDDDADDDGVDAGGADAGGVDGSDDESGARGRTGPFPLPPGGVPMEFNAVSPLGATTNYRPLTQDAGSDFGR